MHALLDPRVKMKSFSPLQHSLAKVLFVLKLSAFPSAVPQHSEKLDVLVHVAFILGEVCHCPVKLLVQREVIWIDVPDELDSLYFNVGVGLHMINMSE